MLFIKMATLFYFGFVSDKQPVFNVSSDKENHDEQPPRQKQIKRYFRKKQPWIVYDPDTCMKV